VQHARPLIFPKTGAKRKRDSAPKKEVPMDGYEEVLRALGRIEGELIEIRKLSERVRTLEVWQAWLKGAWAALTAASVHLCRTAGGK
jgi:hypothetical protein